ncbi:mycofactocin biosynthesis chaperone MftB [Gordonia sp. HY002]|uniref:mycofactocin biosynthesis chaperone MftB n=1 Tax=Gordonia zhenghanii TaxID=2911516 RepID=UPI001EED4B35|nr:mycofactocin biosynthesis chaperone MftB [Gordonia zhenghanii]MCF8570243.1 mycofactocin biosynthesis chaperone MftB [Gordonia zhenghanii]MCF8607056.1 mycofactocin biosynthesis chaperone MftB [Gordonia zhenghanii]
MTTATTIASGDRAAVAGSEPHPPAPPVFDLAAAWTLNPKVALRPEPFGALLYHFGTRKLSFLKNLTVVGIVRDLAEYQSADDALAAAGVTDDARPLYLQALTALCESGMIIPQADRPVDQGVNP